VDGVTPELVVALTLLVVAAAPVVWLFVSRHFKLREKELELEAQTRRDWAALQGKTLDARLTALETVVATLGGGVRQQRPQLPQRAALEAPPDSQSEPGRREPIR
jgi:hypothetical protein